MIHAIRKLTQGLTIDDYLEQHYIWKLPSKLPLDIPASKKSGFESNVYLKEHLAPVLEEDKQFKWHYWVIREWGGIRGFKKGDKNTTRIRMFREQLSRGDLDSSISEVISSLSKLASFWEPKKYAIYDSRAVFALNWLMFRHMANPTVFPQPNGRNTILAQYDLGTLFLLSGVKLAEHKTATAYHAYCKLLRELAHDAFGKDRPYFVEMLLFVAAPTLIIQDIQENTKIKINRTVS